MEDKDGKRIKDDNGNDVRNKRYGRATIDNWRDLVERIEWMRNWKHSMQMSPKEGGETEKETKERERLNRVVRRKLCTVWQLNSMARSLQFDKEKAKQFNT